jgi:ThiC-like protein
VPRSFPSSRKVYVPGSRPDLRVPMREIRRVDSASRMGPIAHDAVTVYDTSNPYTDPAADIDLGAGLPALRARWIAERGDGEERPADAFGERSEPAVRSRLVFARPRPPWRAKAGANVTQMHYARRGLITPENGVRGHPGEPAPRRGRGAEEQPHARNAPGDHLGAGALGGGARPRHRPGQYQPPGVRAHGHRAARSMPISGTRRLPRGWKRRSRR